ncbi:hypothetical protein ACQZ4P_22420 [Agrobacterium vitis]
MWNLVGHQHHYRVDQYREYCHLKAAAWPSESVSASSPQVADIASRRIAALEEQSKSMQAKTAGLSTGADGNLADYSSLFNKLNLDLKMAESRMKSAISDFEKVKLVSSLQLVYLDSFTDLTLPDTNKYPSTGLNLFLSLLAFGAICGAACGTVLLVRKKLD